MANELAKASPEEKVHQVFGWILRGATEHEILQTIEQTWPKEKGRPLIVQAMKRIAESADADPAVVKGWAIEATRSLYQKAVDVGDLATALRAVRQMTDIADR